ncbi:helix-turn-helix domain of transposase ISL3 family protein [Mycobacterium kansasii 732]|nr:helix-turn-helix domain of transposase ISL3 family protein [Mycobacterium kansasii 732]
MTITDAAVDDTQTTIFYTPVGRDPRCPECGRDGRYRDTVTRPLTDLPVAGYPLVLRVAVPATAAPPSSVSGRCSTRTSEGSQRHGPRRRGAVLAMCCGG